MRHALDGGGVADLKCVLRAMGQKVTGTKPILQQRLRNVVGDLLEGRREGSALPPLRLLLTIRRLQSARIAKTNCLRRHYLREEDLLGLPYTNPHPGNGKLYNLEQV